MNCWFSILSVALLAGCTRFESKPILASDTAAQLEARRLDDDRLRQFLETNLAHGLETWPIRSWNLETLTLAAFYFQPSLEVARAQWRATQAGVRTAGAPPNPTLGLTPGYDTSAASGLSPWLPFFNLDVPIETAGKRSHRVAKAQLLSESARLNLTTVAWHVRSSVRANLFDFVAASQRATLLERQSAAQEEIAKLLEQRVAVGAIARPELTTARIALNKTRLDLGDAKSQRVAARARLAESLGLGAPALEDIELASDFPERPADDLAAAEARRIALRGRSDILGALTDYAAAEAELRLQIAKQYPDVHLNPGYQYDQGDNKWTLGLTFELPVWNQNQGPIAEAFARREEIAARFTELQAKVIGEIDRGIAAYHAAREYLVTADALVAGQSERERSVAAQLKAGAADPLELLSARLEVGAAALARLDGQAKLQQALGALEDALQRPVLLLRTHLTVSPVTTARHGPHGSTQ